MISINHLVNHSETCSEEEKVSPLLCIKDKIMKTLMKNFERFAQLLDSGAFKTNPHLSFETVCRCLKVSPSDLNELLIQEIGMDGNEIIAAYRGE